jgi:hypothetical protein
MVKNWPNITDKYSGLIIYIKSLVPSVRRDVPRQNRSVRPTTFRGRTGLSVRRRFVAEPALKFEVLSVGFQDLNRQTDRVFFVLPFSGGLPRVNTRGFFFFFFLPFSGGLPWVNTRVFYFIYFIFIFSRPFPAGCRRGCCRWEWIPKWIPESAEKKKKRVLGFKF